MAMITAIMVCLVVLFLGMTSISLSDHSFSAQRIDRKRVATFHGAEAGIDHALQILQSTADASLPCASPLTASLGTGAGSSDYSVTFTYFDDSGNPMSCPLSTAPASVLLTSTGDSNDPLGSQRQVQVTAELSEPLTTTAFDKVVFSGGPLSFTQSVTIDGNAGNDAVVYANGDYDCNNSLQLAGYIYAQGNAELSNTCALNGDIWTKGSITMTGSATVGRDAISGTSSITMSNTTLVRRNARAGTTITRNHSATVEGLEIPTSPAGDPPSSSFPQISYDATAWTSAGYTIKPYTDCTAAATDLRTLSTTWTTPTVMRITGCRLDIGNSSYITLAEDLAIISDHGIRLSQLSTIATTGAERELHLIVPYAMAGSCSATVGNIEMGNNFEIRPGVRTLAYTPCTLKLQNRGQLQGQFYGGDLQFSQATNIAFRPVSGVPGYSPSTASTLIRYVIVIYKREV